MVYLIPALVLAAFALHLIGERSVRLSATGGLGSTRGELRRALVFYAGLLVIMVALVGPIVELSEKLFWVHMVQHLLLLTVAAPLVVLGRPWSSMWGAFPARMQRGIATVVAAAPLRPLRAVSRAAATPAGAWLVFNVSLVFWHVPGPYDLTLRNISVHVLAHGIFLVAAILLWAQVMSLPPATSKLSYRTRIAYVAGTMVVNVAVSIFLAFAPHPLYTPYAHLLQRPGGISALADQQIGAGIMWTAGDMPFALAIALLAQRWLAEHEARTSALDALITAGQDEAQSKAR